MTQSKDVRGETLVEPQIVSFGFPVFLPFGFPTVCRLFESVQQNSKTTLKPTILPLVIVLVCWCSRVAVFVLRMFVLFYFFTLKQVASLSNAWHIRKSEVKPTYGLALAHLQNNVQNQCFVSLCKRRTQQGTVRMHGFVHAQLNVECS